MDRDVAENTNQGQQNVSGKKEEKLGPPLSFFPCTFIVKKQYYV